MDLIELIRIRLNQTLSFSLWKMTLVMAATILVSAGLTRLLDTTILAPAAVSATLPSLSCPKPVVCPIPVACPKQYPRAHWERRWKPTPNNNGKGY